MQNIEAIERRLWSAAEQLSGNGEFFTPVSLMQMIVIVIEPDYGRSGFLG